MHYPDLLTARQLASQLSVNHDTLRRWRRQGDGPPWVNLAPHRARPVVRYRQSEVDAWLIACREEGSVSPCDQTTPHVP
jgi:predicted DNA-binding transcriptional regulator AlpA